MQVTYHMTARISDGCLQLWDLRTFHCVQTFQANNDGEMPKDKACTSCFVHFKMPPLRSNQEQVGRPQAFGSVLHLEVSLVALPLPSTYHSNAVVVVLIQTKQRYRGITIYLIVYPLSKSFGVIKRGGKWSAETTQKYYSAILPPLVLGNLERPCPLTRAST